MGLVKNTNEPTEKEIHGSLMEIREGRMSGWSREVLLIQLWEKERVLMPKHPAIEKPVRTSFLCAGEEAAIVGMSKQMA